jgi:hypothetical protein
MAQQARAQILHPHAAAVVADADFGKAALLHADIDPRGACIDGILHQLFNDRTGTLDDFAGSDFLGNRGRQYLDAVINGRHRLLELDTFHYGSPHWVECASRDEIRERSGWKNYAEGGT